VFLISFKNITFNKNLTVMNNLNRLNTSGFRGPQLGGSYAPGFRGSQVSRP